MMGKTLAVVSAVKFLGVYFDEQLNWKRHIDYICINLRKATGIMARIRELVPKRLKRMLYYTILMLNSPLRKRSQFR